MKLMHIKLRWFTFFAFTAQCVTAARGTEAAWFLRGCGVATAAVMNYSGHAAHQSLLCMVQANWPSRCTGALRHYHRVAAAVAAAVAADARPTPPPTRRRRRRRASAGLCSYIQATKDPMLISHLYLMLQVIRRSFSSLISLSHTFPLPFHSIYIYNSKLLDFSTFDLFC